MVYTLAQYKDRIAKKGIPATGDADTQLTHAVNFARRIVWRAYEWPFKRVISSAFTISAGTATYALSTIGSTLKTIKRIVDTTNGIEIPKQDFDVILDADPGLDDTASNLVCWCWYSGTAIMVWPTLATGASSISAKAYGEKTLTALVEENVADSDIVDEDIAEAVIMIAHARACAENDDIVKKSTEYRDGISWLNKVIRDDYEEQPKAKRVPGWDIFTGNTRKR